MSATTLTLTDNIQMFPVYIPVKPNIPLTVFGPNNSSVDNSDTLTSDTTVTKPIVKQQPPLIGNVTSQGLPKKKRIHAHILNFTTISAENGQPSVLWISKTGKYYRTVIDARKDKKGALSMNPYTGVVLPGTGTSTTTVPGNSTTTVPVTVPGNGTTTVPETTTTTPPATTAPATNNNMIMYIIGGIIAILIFIKIIK